MSKSKELLDGAEKMKARGDRYKGNDKYSLCSNISIYKEAYETLLESRTELLKEVKGIVDELKQHCNIEIKKVIEVWKKADINFEPNMEDSQYQNVIDYIDDVIRSKLKALEGE